MKTDALPPNDIALTGHFHDADPDIKPLLERVENRVTALLQREHEVARREAQLLEREKAIAARESLLQAERTRLAVEARKADELITKAMMILAETSRMLRELHVATDHDSPSYEPFPRGIQLKDADLSAPANDETALTAHDGAAYGLDQASPNTEEPRLQPSLDASVPDETIADGSLERRDTTPSSSAVEIRFRGQPPLPPMRLRCKQELAKALPSSSITNGSDGVSIIVDIHPTERMRGIDAIEHVLRDLRLPADILEWPQEIARW